MVKNSGADLEAVQEILGHANISTTKKYAKVAKSEINTAMENLTNFSQNCHNDKRKVK